MTVNRFVQEFVQKRDQITAQNRYREVDQLMKMYANRVKQLSTPEDEIAAELEAIADAPCKQNTHLWIIAAQLRPSPKYLESLNAILEQDDPCIWHEGIVDILYDLADERSIPSLHKALAYDFPYDPTKELAVKILETLAEIGTQQAFEILRSYLQSPSERIRETVALLLGEGNEF